MYLGVEAGRIGLQTRPQWWEAKPPTFLKSMISAAGRDFGCKCPDPGQEPPSPLGGRNHVVTIRALSYRLVTHNRRARAYEFMGLGAIDVTKLFKVLYGLVASTAPNPLDYSSGDYFAWASAPQGPRSRPGQT
jgi:hypothetical protein